MRRRAPRGAGEPGLLLELLLAGLAIFAIAVVMGMITGIAVKAMH